MTAPLASVRPDGTTVVGPELDVLAGLVGGPRIDDLLRRAAASTPDRHALRSPAGDVTYAELDERATRLAAALRGAVGGPGAVVALALVLDPAFAEGFFGISRSGNVPALINPMLHEEALAHVLALAGARAAVVTPIMYRRLKAIRGRLPDLDLVVLTDRPADLDAADVPTLEELLRDAPDGPPPEPDADPDALACLQFTSGTTGMPKGVRLSHRNVTVNAAQAALVQRVTASSVLFDYLPTFHLMHLTIPVTAGATLVLWPDDDVAGSVEAATRYRATHYYSLPVRLTMLATDSRLPELRAPTLTAMLSGGSPLPEASTTALTEQFGVPVVQGYGLQETSPLTHFDDPDNPGLGSCGYPVAGTECRVVHVETREAMPPGEKGEIQVRGPQLMLGYLGTDGAGHLDAEGWFSTGDIGYVEEDGRLFLVDRIKDTFKCDNWLVAPTEIEQVLREHPAVADCVVVDRPDTLHGAVAAAFVVPERTGVDPAELAAFVADRLPYYQHLSHVELVGWIPRSFTGKVQRRDLRKQLLHLLAAPSQGGRFMYTFINRFAVTGDLKEFEQTLEEMTAFMIKQPGFRTHKLYHSNKDPQIYVEVSEWDDPSGHRAAASTETFKTTVQKLMKLATADPAPFSVIAEYDADGAATR